MSTTHRQLTTACKLSRFFDCSKLFRRLIAHLASIEVQLRLLRLRPLHELHERVPLRPDGDTRKGCMSQGNISTYLLEKKHTHSAVILKKIFNVYLCRQAWCAALYQVTVILLIVYFDHECYGVCRSIYILYRF